MTLSEQLNADLLEATKSSNVLVRDTLRFVKTAVKNSEISKGHALSDEEILEVLTKEVKQRVEAASSFVAGNRPDLAAKEEEEMAILKKYLPEQLSEEEVRSFVDQAVTETGASAMSDMGKVMAALMPKVKGRADGNLVSQLVRSKLS